jgi:ribokinase
MVGKVGDDVFGQALLDNLAKPQAWTPQPSRASRPSGVAPILIDEPARTASSSSPAPTAKSTLAAVDRHADLIRSAGMVLCQLELPIATVSHSSPSAPRPACP